MQLEGPDTEYHSVSGRYYVAHSNTTPHRLKVRTNSGQQRQPVGPADSSYTTAAAPQASPVHSAGWRSTLSPHHHSSFRSPHCPAACVGTTVL